MRKSLKLPLGAVGFPLYGSFTLEKNEVGMAMYRPGNRGSILLGRLYYSRTVINKTTYYEMANGDAAVEYPYGCIRYYSKDWFDDVEEPSDEAIKLIAFEVLMIAEMDYNFGLTPRANELILNYANKILNSHAKPVLS